MTSKNFEQISQRALNFVDGYRIGGKLLPMHQLKLEHTLRVAADSRLIAAGMNFSENEINLAEAVGILHDVARFPQFKMYGSFSDAETIDHGDLGVETIVKENMLAGIAPAERDIILHVVKHHNKKSLPPVMTAGEEKFTRLIRDADRIDIFFICWDSIKTGHIHDHPEIIMGIDFYGAPTDAILEQFERGEQIDYRNMNSLADRFVLQLTWILDLTYAATKKLVLDRRILENFIDVLPVKTDRLIACFKKTEDFLRA